MHQPSPRKKYLGWRAEDLVVGMESAHRRPPASQLVQSARSKNKPRQLEPTHLKLHLIMEMEILMRLVTCMCAFARECVCLFAAVTLA